jgi:hypothetical protein
LKSLSIRKLHLLSTYFLPIWPHDIQRGRWVCQLQLGKFPIKIHYTFTSIFFLQEVHWQWQRLLPCTQYPIHQDASHRQRNTNDSQIRANGFRAT